MTREQKRLLAELKQAGAEAMADPLTPKEKAYLDALHFNLGMSRREAAIAAGFAPTSEPRLWNRPRIQKHVRFYNAWTAVMPALMDELVAERKDESE